MSEKVIFISNSTVTQTGKKKYLISKVKTKILKQGMLDVGDSLNDFFDILDNYSDKIIENNEKYLLKYLRSYTKLLIEICRWLKNNDFSLNYEQSNLLEVLLNIDTEFDKTNLTLKLKQYNPIRILKYLFHKNNIYIGENEYFYFLIGNQRFYYDINSSINDNGEDYQKTFDLNKNITAFSIAEQLSTVDAYLIIEKIINRVNEMKENMNCSNKYDQNNEKISINIAVFGKLINDKYLIDYLDKYQKIKLTISYFQEKKNLDYYFFQCDDEVFNIKDRSDLYKLFEKYDMVLFLDFPCFYIEEVEMKSSFNSMDSTIRYYADKLSEDDSLNDIANNLLYCHKALNEFKYSNENPYFMKYVFDRWFVYNIKEFLKQNNFNTHVYFYVSMLDDSMDSAYIRDIVFRKEIYNNRSLIVLRPNVDNAIFKVLYPKNENIIFINLWKVMKYYNQELNKYFVMYDNKEDMIQDLVNSFLLFDFTEYSSSSKINYYLKLSDNCLKNRSLREFCFEKIGLLIKDLKDKKTFAQLRITNSIFSQCPSLNYVLLSYYLNEIDFTKLNLVSNDMDLVKLYQSIIDEERIERMVFVQKSACYNIIDILENTHYKDKDDIEYEIDRLFSKYGSFKNKESFMKMLSYSKKWLDEYKINCTLKENLDSI